MSTETPRTEALLSGFAMCSDAITRHDGFSKLCRQLELESARRLKILRDLMPFVLEGYYPECATPEFKAAVEAAKAEVAT